MQTETIRVALRFNRASARTLRNIAARIRAAELTGLTLSVFECAADAAETGEPLIVECGDPIEAQLMAAGYTQFGVAAPTIETLGGTPRTA